MPILWPWALDSRNLESQQYQNDDASTPHIPDLPVYKSNLLVQLRLLYPHVLATVTRRSPQFSWLMNEWDEYCQRCGTRGAKPFHQSYLFFEMHGANLLDMVDRYLIEALCTSDLARLLEHEHHKPRVRGVLNSTIAFGVGSSIFTYHAIGISLGMSGEQASEYHGQELLFHPITDQELVWHAMIERVEVTPVQMSQFECTHRIPCHTIELPGIEILPGPVLKVCAPKLFILISVIETTTEG